ncbi:MAG: AI-2E family transporter [Chitinophagaceae bacterium]|nr:MAG: AI-2E family transporter [Chitinophagaceae bacterium]
MDNQLPNNHIPNNAIRQILILAIIILLGIVLFMNLKFVLPAFLGAYTLFVLMRKWMFKLVGTNHWNKNLAAATLMIGSFIVILLPVGLLINLMSSKISFAVQHSGEVMAGIKGIINTYEKRFGIVILSDNNIEKMATSFANLLPGILGATFNSILSIVVMYFLLYFMLVDGKKMEASFFESVPLKDENLITLRKDLNLLVYSNALGIPLIALLQGIVAIIGYFIIGVKEPVFWFVITTVGGMLPVIGAALGYIPLTLLFFADGDTGKGIAMMLYGFLVIGMVDNVFRMMLQKKWGDVHPIITIFGVIAGVTIFGFIGLIFGPILISLFLLMIKIYLNEFSPTKDPDFKIK